MLGPKCVHYSEVPLQFCRNGKPAFENIWSQYNNTSHLFQLFNLSTQMYSQVVSYLTKLCDYAEELVLRKTIVKFHDVGVIQLS